jgi:3-hydroxypropanoate dehydrogenase
MNSAARSPRFILAERAPGLSAGPMTGYDAAALNDEPFPAEEHKAMAVANIGKPEYGTWMDRLPRLDFDEAVRTA